MNECLTLLEKAQRGSLEATERLLKAYMPMVDKYAWLDGQIDEDLRQHLIVCFLLAVQRFQIST